MRNSTKHTTRVAGKTVFVSGSSRGLGRETARHFAKLGATVILHGRNSATLTATYRAFQQLGYSVHKVMGDLSSAKDVKRIATYVVQHNLTLDIIIFNAGISMRGTFLTCKYSVLFETINSNVIATLFSARALIPHASTTGAVCLLVSSGAGCFGFPNIIPYSMAKMSLTALQQGLSVELASQRIVMKRIILGFVENDEQKTSLSATHHQIAVNRAHDYTQQYVAQRMVQFSTNRAQVLRLGIKIKILDFIATYLQPLLLFILKRKRSTLH